MIPDFPTDIRIRLAELNFFCCFLTLLIFCPIGQESLVSSNINSKQLKFYSVKPKLYIQQTLKQYQWWPKYLVGVQSYHVISWVEHLCSFGYPLPDSLHKENNHLSNWLKVISFRVQKIQCSISKFDATNTVKMIMPGLGVRKTSK